MDHCGFSRRFITEFIELYKSSPCLWQFKSKEYKNRRLRSEAYKEMILFCRENGFPGANRDFVCKKIQGLRGSFRKELRKVMECLNAGEEYIPNLWYYQLLLFTKDQDQELPSDPLSDVPMPDSKVLLRRRLKTLKKVALGQEVNQPEEIEALPIRPRKRKADRNIQTDYSSDFSDTVNVSRRQDKQQDISEYNATGIVVAKKLQKMDSIQAIYAESLINSVLRKGLLNKLTEDSDVCDGECKARLENSVSVYTTECSSMQ